LNQTRVSATEKRADRGGEFAAPEQQTHKHRDLSSSAIFLPMVEDGCEDQWKGDASVAQTLVFEPIAPSEDLGEQNQYYL